MQHQSTLDATNALSLFADYDIIVDGSDNFATRHLANDAAAILRKPYVRGSVLRFDGEVTLFWEGAPDGCSLDCRTCVRHRPNRAMCSPAPRRVCSEVSAALSGRWW